MPKKVDQTLKIIDSIFYALFPLNTICNCCGASENAMSVGIFIPAIEYLINYEYIHDKKSPIQTVGK